MALKRGLSGVNRIRGGGNGGGSRSLLVLLVFFCIFAPLVFFVGRGVYIDSSTDYSNASVKQAWHVLGLGYNPGIAKKDIENAAVVHYNGNMKPWLELAMSKYRPYWTKYIKFDHPHLRRCNLHE